MSTAVVFPSNDSDTNNLALTFDVPAPTCTEVGQALDFGGSGTKTWTPSERRDASDKTLSDYTLRRYGAAAGG